MPKPNNNLLLAVIYFYVSYSYMGSGCDSVGRAVASNPEVRGLYQSSAKIYFEHLLSTVLKRRN